MKTRLTYDKDPLTDRKGMVAGMKGFKGGKMPSAGFSRSKPRIMIDDEYAPHKGRQKQ